MIIADTREKKWSHIRDYFDAKGVGYQIQKLDVGDYYNTDYPNVVVDRKASLDEVCSNLMPGKNNYHRFVNECKRAKEQNLHLIILIEVSSRYRTLKDVVHWTSRYTKYQGKWLAEGMLHIQNAYGVEWVFTSKRRCAERILELVNITFKEETSALWLNSIWTQMD